MSASIDFDVRLVIVFWKFIDKRDWKGLVRGPRLIYSFFKIVLLFCNNNKTFSFSDLDRTFLSFYTYLIICSSHHNHWWYDILMKAAEKRKIFISLLWKNNKTFLFMIFRAYLKMYIVYPHQQRSDDDILKTMGKKLYSRNCRSRNSNNNWRNERNEIKVYAYAF